VKIILRELMLALRLGCMEIGIFYRNFIGFDYEFLEKRV